MSHLYKVERTCVCGFKTMNRGNWSVHRKNCTVTTTSDSERIASLERQLAEQKEQMKEQLAAKDKQIDELIQAVKKPRTTVTNNTTNNNRYVVEQHINVFGKESIDHITPAQIRALLADPVNAVPKFIKLKH